MIATLGMYDGGHLSPANDALWSAIAHRLRARGFGDVPSSLSRDQPFIAEGLLLGQICGYPFARRLHRQLTIIGAPRYDLPGCEGVLHRSFIVVRAASGIRRLEQLAGTRAIINDPESNTGRNLLGDSLADIGARHPFFSEILTSGSHRRSLISVAQGEADVAAIDCVSYAHALRAEPSLAIATRIIHETRPTPTLPFVTDRATPAGAQRALFEAIGEVLGHAEAGHEVEAARQELHLLELATVDPRAYEMTRQFASRADEVLGPADLSAES